MAKKNGTAAPRRKIIGEIQDHLPVVLSNAELIDRGHQLADVERKVRDLDMREADAKAGFKKERGALETERHVLAGTIRDGKELRPVSLSMEADYDAGVIEYVRTDTGEVTKTRPLGDHERQVPMPSVATAAAAETGA